MKKKHEANENTYNPSHRIEYTEVFDGYEWRLIEVIRPIVPEDDKYLNDLTKRHNETIKNKMER